MVVEKEKTILDRFENVYDKARFLFQTLFDNLSEKFSDAWHRAKENCAKAVGISFVTLVNDMIPDEGRRRTPIMALAVKIFGLLLAVVVWAFVQIVISTIGLVGGLLGMRRGKEYSLTENGFLWSPLLLIGLVIPWAGLNEYWLGRLSSVFSYSIVVLGLNILVGFSGQISLGHGAFVLLGGYCAVGLYGLHVPFAISVFLAGAACSLLGAVVSLPATRIKGSYLALLTLGLMMSAAPILQSKMLRGYTGGSEGLTFDTPAPPEFLEKIDAHVWCYYHSLIIFVLVFIAAHIILRRTKVGRALISIRENEERSGVLGINVPRMKMAAFMMSAFCGGLGGGLLTLQLGFIASQSVTMNDSINYLVALIVGGSGTLLGSFVGGAFLNYQSVIAEWLAKGVTNGQQLLWAVTGGVLLLTAMLAPKGVVGELTLWAQGKSLGLPWRRVHRQLPFPDYDEEEEFATLNGAR